LGPGLGPDLSDGAPIILLPLEARGERTGLLVLATRYSLDAEQMAALRLLTEQAALAAYRTERIDQLEAHATVDEITVIDNRASVLGKLEQAAGRCGRTNQQLATLLIGIDQFPELSKAYGSGVTATVLRQVAYALGTCKRLNDTVGRTELSEFLVVLEGAGETGARQVAARIRQRIAELRFPTLGDTISVTVSMGVAIAPRDGERPTDLILRSQQALHRAQSHGTDQIVGFRDPTNSANVAGLQHA
jgi:diguanylate cyclase (GGDEF)-like protein